MCRLVIIVWTETAKDEEWICKEKSVRELSLIFVVPSIMLYSSEISPTR